MTHKGWNDVLKAPAKMIRRMQSPAPNEKRLRSAMVDDQRLGAKHPRDTGRFERSLVLSGGPNQYWRAWSMGRGFAMVLGSRVPYAKYIKRRVRGPKRFPNTLRMIGMHIIGQ